ncbi:MULTISPECIES: DUF1523 family protein [Methanobacterium]|uniref:Uncharacterized protein n=1 Tax=Methanobacterium bryantii TaxID=2161 RepID=A0A2A2H334_METBR|nr:MULTISPECIES: DUF1523 family protein [Methanobacterium]OEC87666.1 hypothetical protein A9507_00200 [Methanobacterium sp. A39]PAV03696.1 hypothetical protein ASJ80_01650 [Methanobacterium bryantii]
MFVAPSWLEGLLIQVGMYIVIPLIIATVVAVVKWKKLNDMEPHHKEPHHKETHHKESPHNKSHHKEPHHKKPPHKEPHHRGSNHKGSLIITFVLAFIVSIIAVYPLGCVYWWSAYEVPSVQEKIITVQGWETKPGIIADKYGRMVIDNANELMLVTTSNEGFFNNENFLFQKFNTRDIFNQLKVGGTYKIKYYGWRNGYNSGFPNVLSVEQVINETNATNNDYNKYFGTKLAY